MVGKEKDGEETKLKMCNFLVSPKIYFYSCFLKGLEI